ncbi:MAG: hypothetical protein M3Q58_09260 [Bacteroidota bacterium]|nr:hypothetical protein [Bacteroidota bacterium]
MCAIQKGPIRIKGQIGDLTFFTKDGKGFVRESTSLDKSRIEKDPAFKRTRENMSEFGGSAMVGKALRTGLAELIKFMGGRYITSRITGLLRQLIELGSGVRGKRSFEIVLNQEILEGFEFTPDAAFGAVFSAPYDLTANVDRNEVTITVPVFNTGNYVSPPSGATHFRIVNATTVLSDFSYINSVKHYKPVNPGINSKSSISYSAYTLLEGNTPAVLTIVSTIPGAPVLPATAGLIACVGIEFYQEINGDFYLLAAKNAMRIERVF